MTHIFKRKFNLSTITCHDCHAEVRNLMQHRALCPNSRRAKALLSTQKEANKIVRSIVTTNSKDVLFLLDVSGSMAGTKLESAKDALRQIVDTMKEVDRFGLITFDSNAFHKLKLRSLGQLTRQNEIEPLLGRIFAKGGTALYDAVVMGIEQIHDKQRKSMIFVLTDGEDNASTNTLADAMQLLDQYPKISLNIIHVDAGGVRSEAYERLCTDNGRTGTYKVVTETTIVKEVTTTFKTHYENL